ncbi:uncharacterized protein LOC132556510 [Ylistrum balloti]|uniref:uncharacterized protein LOC132556510 n=1 Tax=Ylistrum balloti TaxID=509963 RepID=UPI0029057F8C|nr:uncharacterized protein LOC132556510 [Ylistrum balloti]
MDQLTSTGSIPGSYQCQERNSPEHLIIKSSDTSRRCILVLTQQLVGILFVTGNCADPVSSDPHLMIDTRTYHNIVVFTCDTGYRLSSTYYFAQCRDGVWDKTTPSCDAVECKVYQEQLVYPDRKFYYGDTVSFSCPMEYDMKGPSILTCGPGSSWDQDLPECIAKECKLKQNGRDYKGLMNVTTSGRVCQKWASQIPHSHGYFTLADQANYCRNPNRNSGGPWCYTTDPGLQWELCDLPRCVCDLEPRFNSHLIVDAKDYYYDDHAYFSCAMGYELLGTRSLRCQADGSWSGTFPTCLAIVCPIQSNIDKNLLYQTRTYHFNDTLELTCVNGFTLIGSSTLTCRSDKSWSSSFPMCTEIQCGITGQHPQLRYEYKTYHFSDKVHFSCPVGFHMVGQGILVCTADGSWSMPFPSCNAVICPSPGEEQHFLFAEKSYGYGDSITLTCQSGYIMEGSSTLRCRTDGRWDSDLPICRAISCPTPVTTDEHLLLTDMEYRYTDELHLSCDQGYRVDGRTSLLCQANGTWDGQLPVCHQLAACPVFTLYDTVTVSNASGEKTHYFGTNVGFSCSSGYIIAGPTSITCQEDGTWNSLPPRCITAESQQADMMSSGLGAGLISTFVVLIVCFVVALLIINKRRKMKRQNEVQYPVRRKSSFKRNYAEMDSDISDDYDSFSDSFDNIDDRVMQAKEVSNTYYEFNPLSKVPEGMIAVDTLGVFVKRDLRVEGYVTSTFAKFKEGLQEQANVANLPENKSKNRYKQVFPYDSTRVCLEKENGDTSDYINASYINGYEKTHQYVAAQGPMDSTVNDFWRMVWQLGSTKIVMLTNLTENGKSKCKQYWPNRGSEQFSSITVSLEKEESLATFMIRHLKVQKGNMTRAVTMFHYTAWPDQKAPPSASSLVQFYRKVETQVLEVPIVVHCRNNSSLFTRPCLNIYTVIQQYQSACLGKPSDNYRWNMRCKSLSQRVFVFCRVSVVDVLQSVSPKLPESAFLDGKKEENKHKNRYSNLLPVDRYRPILSTPVEGTNDYINAAFLSDGSKGVQYLTTQMPLPHTVIDFWRLVYEQHVTSIVMLNTELDEQKDTVGVYWPTEENMIVGPFVVTEKTAVTHHLTDIHTLSLQYKQEMPTIVRQFRSRVWSATEACPTSTLEFLRLLGLVREWQTSQQGTVLVHCMNGLDKSGLYCVLDATIQSADVTKMVDIQSTIKQMRKAQPQIIPNERRQKLGGSQEKEVCTFRGDRSLMVHRRQKFGDSEETDDVWWFTGDRSLVVQRRQMTFGGSEEIEVWWFRGDRSLFVKKCTEAL